MVSTLFVVGGLCWTAAYVDAIRVGMREHTYAIPAVAIALNFSWEILFSTHYVTESVGAKSLVDVSWAVLDAVILYTLFRYGSKELRALVAPRWFPVFCVVLVVFGFVLQGSFVAEFGWSAGARYSSFLVNVLMSALFVLMYASRGGPRGQSLVVAVGKGLGTLCLTGIFGVLEGSPLVLAAGGLCAVLDALYVALLLKPGAAKLFQSGTQEAVGG